MKLLVLLFISIMTTDISALPTLPALGGGGSSISRPVTSDSSSAPRLGSNNLSNRLSGAPAATTSSSTISHGPAKATAISSNDSNASSSDNDDAKQRVAGLASASSLHDFNHNDDDDNSGEDEESGSEEKSVALSSQVKSNSTSLPALPTLGSATSVQKPDVKSTDSSTSNTASATPATSAASSASSTTQSSSSSEKSDSPPETVSLQVTNVHQVDLDTLNIDAGGNWLEKRVWYEKAEQLFDTIRVVVGKVVDFRIHFSNEVNAVGQKIDAFYENVSFDKGQIDEMLKDLLEDLDEQQADRGDLSANERELKLKVKKDQANLEQIGKDIKTIGDIDSKIDETLMRAFKVIDKCRSFEESAWNNFKSIGKTLDDKKARSMYYEMENYKENVDQLFKYLQSTLFTYLQKTLVVKIDTNISKIKTSMSDLKAKGIDLEKLMKSYQEADEKVEQERAQEATQIAVEKAVDKAEAEAEARLAKQKAAAKAAMEATLEYKIKASFGAAVDYVKCLFCNVASYVNDASCYVICHVQCMYCNVKSYIFGE